MKLSTSALLVCLVTLGAFAAVAGTPAGSTTASGRIGTEISVHPTESPGVWIGEATVSDIETGEIFAQPRVQFLAGEATSLRSKGSLGEDPREELEVLLEITVGEAGNFAQSTSTVSIGGEIVAKQSASFRLE